MNSRLGSLDSVQLPLSPRENHPADSAECLVRELCNPGAHLALPLCKDRVPHTYVWEPIMSFMSTATNIARFINGK